MHNAFQILHTWCFPVKCVTEKMKDSFVPEFPFSANSALKPSSRSTLQVSQMLAVINQALNPFPSDLQPWESSRNLSDNGLVLLFAISKLWNFSCAELKYSRWWKRFFLLQCHWYTPFNTRPCFTSYAPNTCNNLAVLLLAVIQTLILKNKSRPLTKSIVSTIELFKLFADQRNYKTYI